MTSAAHCDTVALHRLRTALILLGASRGRYRHVLCAVLGGGGARH